jgi:hypothetical protein
MLPSMIQRIHAQIFQRENDKNSIHKKLKIVLSSCFKVYSELGGFFNFRYNISFIDPSLGGFV